MKKTWLTVLIVLMLCVIWGNSLLSGDLSGDLSSGLLARIIALLPFMKWLPELALRKLGHFSEFMVLGLLLCAYFVGQTGCHRVTMPLFFGMLAALTDETIQVFVPDRGPSVVDVWIDTAGVCAGICVLLCCMAAKNRKKKKGIVS